MRENIYSLPSNMNVFELKFEKNKTLKLETWRERLSDEISDLTEGEQVHLLTRLPGCSFFSLREKAQEELVLAATGHQHLGLV